MQIFGNDVFTTELIQSLLRADDAEVMTSLILWATHWTVMNIYGADFL